MAAEELSFKLGAGATSLKLRVSYAGDESRVLTAIVLVLSWHLATFMHLIAILASVYLH